MRAARSSRFHTGKGPTSGPTSELPVIQDGQAFSKIGNAKTPLLNRSERQRPNPYNCQGCIIGLVSVGEVIHSIEH
jgi:hypothetical protein